ncbi:MAG: type II toxin-antitoxin system HipA family toxin [Lachnospiraceae bacterium]|nr:type II toxin-antitoxin system HipA family toxin [Lachnospiraceae bacterium]
MNHYKSLQVFFEGQPVGTLAVARDYRVAFSYHDSWLAEGFSLNPLSLPLRKGVFLPKKYDPFEGLFGVFADSLPDGWGRLLVDRLLRKRGVDPFQVDSLNRLAIVGSGGMGALTYQPETLLTDETADLSLDQIAVECNRMLTVDYSDNLDELFEKGGSSGGARPKIFTQIDGEEWIVKFPSSADRADIGTEEYAYSVCARKCGIDIPETRLLPSALCSGYFAVKRFDRRKMQRVHMVSVSGLLETSHRIPNLDYNTLMQLTFLLTHNYEEIEKLYRLMCFNVFAHNRDDHSKNFSFLYEDQHWRLSPAYDLTFSNSMGREHATTVAGNGRNPGMRDLLAVAGQIKYDSKKAMAIAKEVQEIVNEELSPFMKERTTR